ncbi:hypothetical protein MKEN_00551100 [Mycena kentingensis (nom. inval.)]|nr:hypothetical protein MKEN_00551100 [Mycena kentingensis (nom. inval.)]
MLPSSAPTTTTRDATPTNIRALCIAAVDFSIANRPNLGDALFYPERDAPIKTSLIPTTTMDAWSLPEYDLMAAPRLLTTFSKHFSAGDFPRSAKWSCDGSALLIHCENRSILVVDPETGTTQTLLQSAPIVDCAWYPTASTSNPTAFCLVASVRETPVKLLDASDGRLRASYRIVDHRERQIAPHSLAFNPMATQLYCGFESAIEVFDVSKPGDEGLRLLTSPTKKSKDGLKGIISALAFQTIYDGSALYAAGSLSATSCNIAVYSGEDDKAIPLLFLGGGPLAAVTQLKFNPAHPHILYASFRRHRAIYAWDLRGPCDIPITVFSAAAEDQTRVARNEETNQKRLFDVNVGGRYLAVGDQDGGIAIFDLNIASTGTVAGPRAMPVLRFPAHGDAIGAVAFHPTLPRLVSVGGSRHFDWDSGWNSSEEDEGEEGGERRHPERENDSDNAQN